MRTFSMFVCVCLCSFFTFAATEQAGKEGGEVNLAQMEGVRCRVDSFYSTVNSADRKRFLASPTEAEKPERYAFGFEDLGHRKLKELREEYDLEKVIAGGKGEIEKLALLRSWVKARWKHTGPKIFPRWDALEILRLAEEGEKFYCVQSAIVLMQCAEALGWQARKLEIHSRAGGDHSVIEVWSRDFGKWVIMDPDFNVHYERGGVPLGALEMHDAWQDGKIDDIELVRLPCPYSFDEKKGADLYRHIYVVWRNDFFSRPDAPIRLLHLVDEDTDAQLVDDGKLLFPDPKLFGPRYPYVDGKPGFMRPFTLETKVVVDGDEATAWVADDDGKAHFVEVLWPSRVRMSRMRICWPKIGEEYVVPAGFTTYTREGAQWEELMKGELEQREGQYPVTLPLPPGDYDGLRIECGAGGAGEGPGFGVAEIEVYAE